MEPFFGLSCGLYIMESNNGITLRASILLILIEFDLFYFPYSCVIYDVLQIFVSCPLQCIKGTVSRSDGEAVGKH